MTLKARLTERFLRFCWTHDLPADLARALAQQAEDEIYRDLVYLKAHADDPDLIREWANGLCGA